MVKVINPFLSVECRGKFGGCIYQTGLYGQYVRGYVPQTFKPTEAQLLQNYLFGVAADKWRLLSDEEKEELNRRANPMKMTGFNLYIKENIKSPSQVKYGQARYGSGHYV